MNNQKIQELAIVSGFKLKEQPDGTLALNAYVFEFARTLLAAHSAEMNIPEGWKLVPKKETPEMRGAFRDAEKSALLSGHDHIEAFFCGYRAMLAAAPTPPEQEAEPVAWMIEIEVTRGVIQRMFHGHNAIGDYRKSFPDATSRPLYTAPQDTKLRKAAEEFIRAHDSDTEYCLRVAVQNLRAALEGK